MKNNIIYKILSFCIFFSISNIVFASDEKNFLSLKNNEVNLRQGPAKDYPIKLIYVKKYLPVAILDKSETWRKTKDYSNNTGWIHISQLSKKKTAINIENFSLLYKRPTIYSKPIAKLEIGRLVLIEKCKKKWCKVSSGDFSGWINKNFLWGNVK